MDKFSATILACLFILATSSASLATPMSSVGDIDYLPTSTKLQIGGDAVEQAWFQSVLSQDAAFGSNLNGSYAQYLSKPSDIDSLLQKLSPLAQSSLRWRDAAIQKENPIPPFAQPRAAVAEPGVLSLLMIGIMGVVLARRISASH
ncbi:MAG TPA: hypothetical protein VM553_15095 [Dongiaceae bacterium]|nr:hypothetical protein [Dongiaceae bacterium]